MLESKKSKNNYIIIIYNIINLISKIVYKYEHRQNILNLFKYICYIAIK